VWRFLSLTEDGWVIDELTTQIEALEEVIEETASSLEATQLLITISSVSFYSSLLIAAEIGEVDWFDEAKEGGELH